MSDVSACLPAADEAGCLTWTSNVECAANEECDDTGDEPVCVCLDICETLDNTRCDGTVVQTCEETASACLDWTDTQDCANDGMVCSTAGGDAQCAAACTDECTASGDLRCEGDLIQVCEEGAEG